MIRAPEPNMQYFWHNFHHISQPKINPYNNPNIILSIFYKQLAVINFTVDNISPKFATNFIPLPSFSSSRCTSKYMVSPFLKCYYTIELFDIMKPLLSSIVFITIYKLYS